MGVWPLEIFQFFQRGDRLYTSVCRRQILMYKDDPRAERVKQTLLLVVTLSTHTFYTFVFTLLKLEFLMRFPALILIEINMHAFQNSNFLNDVSYIFYNILDTSFHEYIHLYFLFKSNKYYDPQIQLGINKNPLS